MTTIHPPLTAEDFETQYDAEHRYMFTQDEDGETLYAYGHDRDDEFIRQAREFDKEIGGIPADMLDVTVYSPRHIWAITIEPRPEWRFTCREVDENTPGAFPVSVL
ncbi:hypothetical protein [Mycobacteroides abscessus]|uniref:Uncharacterized protein n=1 Tax=Mycobacteroides abscessus subsp. massiliense TaxID=1962118 RepID=A0A1U1C2V3_9MYCO|nr:hypothetical protein [Mycobacteroides abscessus]MBE5476945.1 hypothetical protein [Mycobacteroides abscessus]MBN7354193.1 hypothetical protein [Mycobacteroides abscessus subsp. abscessus]MBN7522064.1 hypothetical protein [Mycobacteroides abscessus subsp. abscessus]MDO3123124.1 hypothetical protein [Mycobacteroides abscessus subsp. abscessus]MDO3142626.1 hypothetical protein [Mycobacteroides abscessus subsp. massiliense]